MRQGGLGLEVASSQLAARETSQGHESRTQHQQAGGLWNRGGGSNGHIVQKRSHVSWRVAGKREERRAWRSRCHQSVNHNTVRVVAAGKNKRLVVGSKRHRRCRCVTALRANQVKTQ